MWRTRSLEKSLLSGNFIIYFSLRSLRFMENKCLVKYFHNYLFYKEGILLYSFWFTIKQKLSERPVYRINPLIFSCFPRRCLAVAFILPANKLHFSKCWMRFVILSPFYIQNNKVYYTKKKFALFCYKTKTKIYIVSNPFI